MFEITSLYDSAYHRDIEDLTEKQLPRHFKQKVIRFNSLDTRSEEKKVKFSVSIPEKLPIAMLDRRLMRMTLENLLSNAVKYTPENGSVELHVAVKGNVMEYVVKDTGCGIPKAEQKKMFTKLFRASNVLNVSGNGFGLFVAKGAVEAQGGSVSFVSTEGEGTTFTVTIPLIEPSQQA